MDVDVGTKIDYLGTGIHNVLMSEQQLWSLITDSLPVVYAVKISNPLERKPPSMHLPKQSSLMDLSAEFW